MTSRQVTLLPNAAKHAPVTSPTYPVPTTQIFFISSVPPCRSSASTCSLAYYLWRRRPRWIDSCSLLLSDSTERLQYPLLAQLIGYGDPRTKGFRRRSSPIVVASP